MEKNLFEIASREGYRYEFRGLISTEDLWKLKVEDLDTIFKKLNAELKKTADEESLLAVKSDQDETLENKIEIIKYIVNYKMDQSLLAKKAIEIKQKKQHILELISKKKDEDLANKSVDELLGMLEELDK